MNINDFNKVVDDQLKLCKNILISKGTEYAFTKDRLKSFKDAAVLLNTTPSYALCGQLAKHLISIMDMCKSTEHFDQSKWNEKITDAINYLCLLKALIIEDNEKYLEKGGINE